MKYTKVLAIFAAVLVLVAFTKIDATKEKEAVTIVEIASANENLSSLVTALEAAGLVETLNGDGPFTVFAPTNDAFAALPEGKLDKLLKPENKEKLKSILTYHVVEGKVWSSDLEDGQSVATVEGTDITISVDDADTMVNGANIAEGDIEASNGVIHIIDKLLEKIIFYLQFFTKQINYTV